MKKMFSILLLTFALGLFCRAVTLAQCCGTWIEGGQLGRINVSFLSDGTVQVRRFVGTNGFVLADSAWGTFTASKTGLRTFSVQTGTNSYTGTAFNGVLNGKFKDFVNGSTGTLQCAPQSNAEGF